MTVKEWLMRAWHIDKEIDAMTDPDPDGAMVAYMHIEEKIDARIDDLTQVKAEILNAIETVKDSTFRTLLISRHICFKTWEQI